MNELITLSNYRAIQPDVGTITGSFSFIDFARTDKERRRGKDGFFIGALYALTFGDFLESMATAEDAHNNQNYIGVGYAVVSFAVKPVKAVDKIVDLGDVTTKAPLSLEQRAAELVKRNANKNSVTIKHQDGQIRVDLEGKAHSSKELGNVSVPTPHAQAYKNNIIPKGTRQGQVGSITKDGDVIPGTSDMLRMVDRYFKSQGK